MSESEDGTNARRCSSRQIHFYLKMGFLRLLFCCFIFWGGITLSWATPTLVCNQVTLLCPRRGEVKAQCTCWGDTSIEWTATAEDSPAIIPPIYFSVKNPIGSIERRAGFTGYLADRDDVSVRSLLNFTFSGIFSVFCMENKGTMDQIHFELAGK